MDQQRMRKAQLKFKMRGLTLAVDALKAVIAFLDDQYLPDDECLEQLAAEVDKISFRKNVITKEAVLELISAVTGITNAQQNAINVVDAFRTPKFAYDGIRKCFYSYTDAISIHGEASAKAALYRNRLHLLQQRVVRDKQFAKRAFDVDETTYELSTVQSLIGCTGIKWIMGIVSQLEDGRFYLEDTTGEIHVDFSQAISFRAVFFVWLFFLIYLVHKIMSGFLTENCIIIAEGMLQPNRIFQINTCGFPPTENRSISLAVTAGLDLFGAGALSREEVTRLEILEKKAVNDMFVVISDVWLDDEETMQKLETVLDGYESVDVVPCLFILMGNFCSHPCNLAFHRFGELRSSFSRLGSLIASHPRISESKFVLIPGPDDPGPSNVLPRPPLPKCLTDEFKKHVPDAIFASNPCRIRYFSQELVFFRENLMYRMRRSCIIPPSDQETTDHFENLVVTVTHQSHLCPLPLTAQPIVWEYDHALWLYPTPHTIVLADRSENRHFTYTGVTTFNPGSFSVDRTFAAYRPAAKEVELCEL